MRKITRAILLIILAISCIQCEENTLDEFQVVTEDIVYVSGEVLRSTGRILSLGQESLQDHGFIIANNEGFTDPVFISLGSKDIPGRFFGQTTDLLFETDYFCKAYLLVEGDTIFGNIRSFRTLEPSLKDYGPQLALAGQKMIINGKNLTEDTRVFFDDVEAEILELNFESEIVLLIPEIDDHYQSHISVKTLDRHLHFTDSFEYIFGKWEFVRDFPEDEQRSLSVFFKEGDQFIFGLGWDGGFRDSNKFWSMDLNTFERTEIPFDGEPMREGFFSEGYFGTGIQGQGPFALVFDDFWKYENGTFEYKGLVPFSREMGKAAFTVDGVLYAVGGPTAFATLPLVRQVWRYDEPSNTWSQHDTAPEDIFGVTPYFVANNRAYFITRSNNVWEYDPVSKSWNVVAIFPSQAKQEAFTLVLNGRAYIGLQGNDWTSVYLNEIKVWELNLTTFEWKIKVDFPGNPVHRVNGYFEHNGKLYVMRYDLRGFGRKKMEMWALDPMALK